MIIFSRTCEIKSERRKSDEKSTGVRETVSWLEQTGPRDKKGGGLETRVVLLPRYPIISTLNPLSSLHIRSPNTPLSLSQFAYVTSKSTISPPSIRVHLSLSSSSLSLSLPLSLLLPIPHTHTPPSTPFPHPHTHTHPHPSTLSQTGVPFFCQLISISNSISISSNPIHSTTPPSHSPTLPLPHPSTPFSQLGSYLCWFKRVLHVSLNNRRLSDSRRAQKHNLQIHMFRRRRHPFLCRNGVRCCPQWPHKTGHVATLRAAGHCWDQWTNGPMDQ